MTTLTSATKIETNENGVTWFTINGTTHEFDNEVVGLTEGGRVLDCDGCPVTPGDNFEIHARQAIDSKDDSDSEKTATLQVSNLKVNNSEFTATFDYAGDSYFYNLNFQELSVMENGEAILSDSEDNLHLSVELDQDWGNEKTHV